MDNKITSYKPLLTQREYLKLIAANLINRFGDSIDAIAYSWLMYEITNSAALMALILGLNYIPTILLQPFVGAWVENMPKKLIMSLFDVGRGIVVILAVVLYRLELLTPGVLIAMTLVISTMETFRSPAGSAIVPKILEEQYYTIGTALNQSSSRIMEIVGLAAAGGVVAWLGCEGALLIDAATFFISAGIIATIRLKETLDKNKTRMSAVWGGLKDGFKLVWEKKQLLSLLLVGALINFSVVPLNAYSVAFVSDWLKGGAEMLSAVNLILCGGMALGSFICPKLTKITDRAKLVVFGVMVALSLVAFGSAGYVEGEVARFAVAFAGCFVLGFGTGIINVVFNAAFMKLVPADYMARMSGIASSFLCCTMPLGSFVCSALASVVALPIAIAVAGGLSMILYISILGIKSLKEL